MLEQAWQGNFGPLAAQAELQIQALAESLGFAMHNSVVCTEDAPWFPESLGPDAVVATVLPDDNKKYLSTDLLRTEGTRESYVSPEVEFTGYRAFKRVCHTCCDLYDCTQRFTDSGPC